MPSNRICYAVMGLAAVISSLGCVLLPLDKQPWGSVVVLLLGAAVGAVVLLVMESIETAMSQSLNQAMREVHEVSVAVKAGAGKVGNAAQSTVDALKHLRIIFAVTVVARLAYTHFKNQRKETKESSFRPKDVLNAMDGVIAAIFAILCLKEGWGVARATWSTMRDILMLTRQATSGIGAITTFFGSPNRDDNLFGVGYAEELHTVADRALGRVPVGLSDFVAGEGLPGSQVPQSASASASSSFGPAEGKDEAEAASVTFPGTPEPSSETVAKEYKLDANAVAMLADYAYKNTFIRTDQGDQHICIVCAKRGTHSQVWSHLHPTVVNKLRAHVCTTKNAAHEGLRELWNKTGTKAEHLKNASRNVVDEAADTLERHPIVAIFTILILFSALYCVSMWLHTPSEKKRKSNLKVRLVKEPTRSEKREKNKASEASSSDESNTSSGSDSETVERKRTQTSKTARAKVRHMTARKAGRTTKPWIDYDKIDADTATVLYLQDEGDQLVALHGEDFDLQNSDSDSDEERPGKRATRHARAAFDKKFGKFATPRERTEAASSIKKIHDIMESHDYVATAIMKKDLPKNAIVYKLPLGIDIAVEQVESEKCTNAQCDRSKCTLWHKAKNAKQAVSAHKKAISFSCNFCKDKQGPKNHTQEDCIALKTNKCGTCGKIGHGKSRCPSKDSKESGKETDASSDSEPAKKKKNRKNKSSKDTSESGKDSGADPSDSDVATPKGKKTKTKVIKEQVEKKKKTPAAIILVTDSDEAEAKYPEPSAKTYAAIVKGESKEALVNGKRFPTGTAAKAVGFAEANGNCMNFVSMWNGFVTMKHIFNEGDSTPADTPIVFHGGDTTWKMEFKQAREVGNDLLWFPRPHACKMPSLSAAEPIEGVEVMLIAYASHAEFQKSNFSVSTGPVCAIESTKPGSEKAVYRASSLPGNCGGAVINHDGRIVGWHHATRTTTTVFIPVTAHIMKQCTGNTSF